MEAELREAVVAASTRADVMQAVDAVYATLADAIEARRPICKTSGRCCRFEEFGHRLYVSTLELARFIAEMNASKQPSVELLAIVPDDRLHLPIFPHNVASATSETGCRFQIEGLCSVHGHRPFGCRIFFCDETSTEWQHEMYEKLHGRLRALHDELGVPYYYVEWRFALQVCL